jgi:translation initiation factor IF-2
MNDDTKKVLSLGGKPKLELKKPVSSDGASAAGSVRQSFSHGRSKTVAVEVRQRKRTEKETAEAATRQQMVKGPEPGTSVSVNERGRATSAVIRQLTPEERDARARALRGAVLDHDKRDGDMPIGEGGAAEISGDPLRQRELEELRRIQEQEKSDSARRGDAERMRVATRAGETAAAKAAALLKRGVIDEEEGEGASRQRRGRRGTPAPRRMGEGRRAGGKITVTQALSAEDGAGRMRSVASMRRRIEREKRQAMQHQEQQKITRDVTIPEAITVQELANRMAERGADVIKTLMKLGVMATITQTIDADTAGGIGRGIRPYGGS